MEVRLKDHYDWVVLGDHPGALLSAGIMAGAGFSVLVLPLSPSWLARVSDDEQLLDHEENFLFGLGKLDSQSGLLRDALVRLGLSQEGLSRILDEDQFLPEIVTTKFRFGIRKSHEYFSNEVQREFGEGSYEASGLLPALSVSENVGVPFWSHLPKKLVQRNENPNQKKKQPENAHIGNSLQKLLGELQKKKGSLPKNARQWFQSQTFSQTEKMEELLSGVYYSVTDSLESHPKALELIQLMSLTRTGGSFKGGLTELRKILLELAQKKGAVIPRDIECRRVFVESGKLIGVQVTQRGKMISVDGGMIGCSINHAKEYLYFSGDQKKYPLKTPPKPQGWKFTVALTVHEKAIPPGMRSRVIWKEAGAPFIEIEVGDPNHYEYGDSRHRYLFLRTILPYTQESLDSEYQRDVSLKMFRQLKEIIPFLDFHVVRIHPDFRESKSAEDSFKSAYGFLSPEFIPENLRVYYGDSGLGYQSGVKGLYLGSGEAYPLLGTFGSVLSAIEATSDFVLTRSSAGTSAAQLKEFWNAPVQNQLQS